MDPATAGPTRVLATLRSVTVVMGSVTEGELLSSDGSVVVGATVAVALLVIDPVKLGSIVPVMDTMTVPPTGIVASALTFPEPVAGAHVAPPAVVHVQVGVRTLAGMRSAMVTPAATDGPALLAVSV